MFLFIKKHLKVNNTLLTILFTAFVIVGCQSTSSPMLSDGPLQASTAYDPELSVATGEMKDALLLKKSAALIQENNPAAAKTTLSELNPELSPNLTSQKQLVDIELAIAQGQFAQAKSLIESIQKTSLLPYDQYRLARAKVKSFNQQANVDALRAYIALAQVAPSEQMQAIVDESWRVTANISQTDLKNIIITSDEFIIQGWLELRNIYETYRDNSQNTALMETAIENWRIRHPHNPATVNFPSQFLTPGQMPAGFEGGISSTNQVNSDAKVALLLPLSGSKQVTAFAEAIQDGFDYANSASGTGNTSMAVSAGMSVIDELTGAAPSPQITTGSTQYINYNVYDTNQKDINAILIEAEQAGITTVVGPLLKPDVEKLEQYTGPIKILALNAPEVLSSNPNICYFALSPEDEAKDAANHMYNQGKRSALLLVPYGNLGDRIANAFNSQWQQLTGTTAVVRTLHETNDLKIMGGSRDPLDISGPVQQANIDAIYVVAEPEKLLLVKPMISSATGGKPNIGIFASSRSNKNSLGPDYRMEMQGVQFSEIPLLANINSPSYQSAMDSMNNDYSLIRLRAMGADANRLSQQFDTLSTAPEFTMQGDTGLITIGANCEIQRKLNWIEYNEGLIVNVTPN
ncbi:penicillin-binding protein activator [Thorsellia anophelis]|uniref:Penicillin-binding protein activator LpoA n=1 Tax=Thorsellia anophelis DSM 18579 TaxID=1123402 RepID=A0A1I0AQL1_9GAMM|nr:penicillin-binding protein activator [Thorsellia anophelis]SES96610.1 hypothetical protein SAMN02583745_01020 [Thorsellia anophelis DSM 18579]